MQCDENYKLYKTFQIWHYIQVEDPAKVRFAKLIKIFYRGANRAPWTESGVNKHYNTY